MLRALCSPRAAQLCVEWDVCCVRAEDAWPQGGRLTTPCLLPFQKPFAWPVSGVPERAATEFFLGCLILSSLSPVFLLF